MANSSNATFCWKITLKCYFCLLDSPPIIYYNATKLRQALAKWETGNTIPDMEKCIRLADL